MEETTTTTPVSSPPSFMQKVEEKKAEVEKAAAKEETAAERDAKERRAATITKATSRLVEQADYLTKIEAAVKGALPGLIAENSLGEALDLFVDFEIQVLAIETRAKELKAMTAMAREVSFPARMDAEEAKTTTSNSGHRMSRTAKIFASIIADTTGAMTKRAFEWLRENNYGSLIKETVNSSSLSAAAKELIENGKELPDDIFNIHTKDSVSITKGKKKP